MFWPDDRAFTVSADPAFKHCRAPCSDDLRNVTALHFYILDRIINGIDKPLLHLQGINPHAGGFSDVGFHRLRDFLKPMAVHFLVSLGHRGHDGGKLRWHFACDKIGIQHVLVDKFIQQRPVGFNDMKGGAGFQSVCVRNEIGRWRVLEGGPDRVGRQIGRYVRLDDVQRRVDLPHDFAALSLRQRVDLLPVLFCPAYQRRANVLAVGIHIQFYIHHLSFRDLLAREQGGCGNIRTVRNHRCANGHGKICQGGVKLCGPVHVGAPPVCGDAFFHGLAGKNAAFAGGMDGCAGDRLPVEPPVRAAQAFQTDAVIIGNIRHAIPHHLGGENTFG